jgi:hypothetical protein
MGFGRLDSWKTAVGFSWQKVAILRWEKHPMKVQTIHFNPLCSCDNANLRIFWNL